MTRGLHYFILADDGSLKRLRIGTFERIPEQKARLPAHRGKTVKLVEVGAEVDENDVPVGVYRMTGSYLTFDEEGVLDRDAWMESSFQAVSGALSDDAPDLV